MIIESLTLKNFRQFKKSQIIKFSTDPTKKVTLVIAESGVGKTTLIEAFGWVLYGETKYSTVLNNDIREEMPENSKTEVEAELSIAHAGKKYQIKRSQTYYKVRVRVEPQEPIFVVDIKNSDGTTDQKRGRDADKIIKEIMHKDLYPYFFLEGESLTRVGEQMSRGKTGGTELAKAIKGLLGFNYLYEAKKHLEALVQQYNGLISRNTTNIALTANINRVAQIDSDIETINNRLATIEKEMSYNESQRENLYTRIVAFGQAEEKQKRTKQLRQELAGLATQLSETRKQLFKIFSADSSYFVMSSLEQKVMNILKESDALDKGIPGIEASAVEYMLKQKKCICGQELVEGSDHWKELQNWIAYLPPQNIGFELKRFQGDISFVKRQSDAFISDFARERKRYNDLKNQIHKGKDELADLEQQIGSISVDIAALKDQEKSYGAKVEALKIERTQKKQKIDDLAAEQRQLLKEQDELKKRDEKTKKIQSYSYEAYFLARQIGRYCTRKEEEKRNSLVAAINEIFSDFYKEKIKFGLDQNYGVQIKISDTELSQDFTSGGQDVAIALAFIGAVMKVNAQKDLDPESLEENETMESYPLVLDAPTSAFGMRQMDSFSEIMPKITEQIIVLINDKDGPILIDKMSSEIGMYWHLTKEGTYSSTIQFGRD